MSFLEKIKNGYFNGTSPDDLKEEPSASFFDILKTVGQEQGGHLSFDDIIKDAGIMDRCNAIKKAREDIVSDMRSKRIAERSQELRQGLTQYYGGIPYKTIQEFIRKTETLRNAGLILETAL